MALSAASRFDLLGNRRFHIKLTHLKVCLPGEEIQVYNMIKIDQVLRTRLLSLCPNDQAARFYTASILIAVEALWDRNATWWGLVAFSLVNRWTGEGKIDLWSGSIFKKHI